MCHLDWVHNKTWIKERLKRIENNVIGEHRYYVLTSKEMRDWMTDHIDWAKIQINIRIQILLVALDDLKPLDKRWSFLNIWQMVFSGLYSQDNVSKIAFSSLERMSPTRSNNN